MDDDEMDYYERLCRISEITEELSLQKDPLRNLLDKSFTPRNRILKIIFIIAAFTYGLSVLMSIHSILSSFDYGHLLNYGAFMGVQIFLIESLWILLDIYEKIHLWGQTLQPRMFAFELSDSKFFSKDSGMVRLVKFITYVNYALGALTTLGLLFSQDVLKEIIYIRVWTCRQFSATTCSVSGYLLSLLDIPVICSTVTIPFIMVYYEIVDIVHVNYLNEMVKQICTSRLPEAELYDSEIFNRKVSQKMKMCIMVHECLIGLSNEGTALIYLPTILVCTGSLIMGSSMLLFTVSYDFNQFSPFVVGVGSGTLNYLICIWLYIYFSQLLKNESERTHYLLTQLPWYYMNKENRKMYSVFLRKAEKPISCEIDLFEVNFLLLVRIFKALYSVAAIIVRFQPRSE